MLSVIIITKNEALNIRRCLESVLWAEEIILVDSGSTDKTVAIAKEYTDKVYLADDWQGYGVQKQRALSYASGDWVLNLDADEAVDLELKSEILQAMSDNQFDAYRVPIQMYFYDKPLHYSSSPKRHVRLFKRLEARFSDDIVHEKIVLPERAKIGRIKTPIMHHSFRDITHALYKINRYSSYTAKTRIKNNKHASLTKAMMGTTWMFFRCYILQRGFMDGREGLVFALLNAQGTFYRTLKQVYRDFSDEGAGG